MTKGLIPSSKGVSTLPEIKQIHTCQLALGDRAEIQGFPSDPSAVLADWHYLASAKKQR